MPTTVARRWCIPLAIKCFQRQTYSNRELLIVFDGPGSIKDLIPDTDKIRLVELSGERLLGEKFNECVRLAKHDHIALWSDDDWHAPWRLEKTVAKFSATVRIAGTHITLCHHLQKRETWFYDWDSPQPFRKPFAQYDFLLGGTLAFHKSIWEQAPFPDVASAIDSGFVHDALIKNANPYAVIPDFGMYVGMYHGDNTRGEFKPNWPYVAWHGDIDDVMGGDYSRYLRAFTGRVCRG